MKKILLFAVVTIMATACSKTPANNTVTAPASNTSGNTVTTVDNGTTYTYSIAKNITTGINCNIEKTTSDSRFTLSTNATISFPISMTISEAIGPINSLGIYKIAPVDSFGFSESRFEETYSGGEDYTVDSVLVNITTCAGTTVLGTYQLWLTNITGNKIVTGNINCYNATIN